MVTGDDVITGAAIARQLGIDGEAILGADFAALPESERLARIDDIGVVGRVAPEHKVLLADTLKKKGHVVAMTGDGVNDAPAIKAADIGIAMGTGTEVAKNARDGSDQPASVRVGPGPRHRPAPPVGTRQVHSATARQPPRGQGLGARPHPEQA
jgi:magnesium-transporting ATPase (P-type)